MKTLILFLSFLLILISFKVNSSPQHYPIPQYSIAQQCELNDIHYTAAVEFVKELQSAIKLNDPLKIANLINYPLRVNFPINTGKKYRSEHQYMINTKQFLQEYDDIFTKNVKLSILNHAATQIFCNYQGAMIGYIWFAEKNKAMRIIAVNVIPYPPAP